MTLDTITEFSDIHTLVSPKNNNTLSLEIIVKYWYLIGIHWDYAMTDFGFFGIPLTHHKFVSLPLYNSNVVSVVSVRRDLDVGSYRLRDRWTEVLSMTFLDPKLTELILTRIIITEDTNLTSNLSHLYSMFGVLPESYIR